VTQRAARLDCGYVNGEARVGEGLRPGAGNTRLWRDVSEQGSAAT
jgi:hypothetical protein